MILIILPPLQMLARLGMRFSMYDLANFLANGDEGDRTPDPLLARQVLSQLSYTPRVSKYLFVAYSLWA